MIIEALYSHLSADVDFIASAGSRLYPAVAPQGTSPPFVTYSMDSDETDRLMGGDLSSLRIARISTDCYALTVIEAHELATTIENSLLPVHGELGTLTVPQIVDDVRLARPRFELFETDTRLFRVSLQFAIAYYP